MPFYPGNSGSFGVLFALETTIPRVHAWAEPDKYYQTWDFPFYDFALTRLTANITKESNGDLFIENWAGYYEALEIFYDFYGHYPDYPL